MAPKTRNGVNAAKKKKATVKKACNRSAARGSAARGSAARGSAARASPIVDSPPNSDSEATMPEGDRYTDSPMNPQEYDIEDQPLPPSKFFFKHNEYKKACRLSSRAEDKTIEEIGQILGEGELDWFREHRQFKHLWHMHREGNHKYSCMWLLLMRTVNIGKDGACWFVVNGIPIRYSIWEHGLLSGLDCRNYPPNHKNMGSLRFFCRHFGREKKGLVKIRDVKEKLGSMLVADGERLKMAVLLFLCTVVAPTKKHGHIDPYLFRIVDDLEAVDRFPWGRYTFDGTVDNIYHMMDYFQGRVRQTWCFPGFVIPLEIIACECIPELRRWYREDVENALPSCPRMCKQKWKNTGMRGYPFEEINETLGDTKEIESIIQASQDEQGLLDEILEGVELFAATDPAAQTWEKWLLDHKKICWAELFHLDVGSRDPAFVAEDENEQQSTLPPISRRPLTLQQLEAKIIRQLESGFASMNNKFDLLESRVQCLEVVLNESLNRDVAYCGPTGDSVYYGRSGYEEGGPSGPSGVRNETHEEHGGKEHGGADAGVGVTEGADDGEDAEVEGEESDKEDEEEREESGKEIDEDEEEESDKEEVAEATGEEEESDKEAVSADDEEHGGEGAESDKEEADEDVARDEAAAGTTEEETAAEELVTLGRGSKRKTKPSRFLKTPYTRRKKN